MRVEVLDDRSVVVLESEQEGDLCADRENVEAVIGGPIQELEEAVTTTAQAACPAGVECCQRVVGEHSVERHVIDAQASYFTATYKLRVRHDQDDAACRDRARETFTGLQTFLGTALAEAKRTNEAVASTIETGHAQADEIMDAARLAAEAAETAADVEAAATERVMLANARERLTAILPALTAVQAEARN